MADTPVLIYGLIGYPLTHSFSKNYFNEKFKAEGINARYLNFELPDIGDLMEAISEYPALQGFNVTIPYKEQVMGYLNEIDPVAEKIGAVNVVKIIRHKGSMILKGYNSDVVGFCDSVRPLLKPWHKKALILGTGGASKAVYHGLIDLGVEPVLVSRTNRDGVLAYGELTPEIMNEYKVVVNTTPLGMYPHMDECPDIPYQLLTPEHLCYDLLYNPDVTLFMKRAADYGAVTKNGLEMLLLQAFVSWNIWNSK
ncbi:shikimate dehydrogenase [Muribaculum caecicola]|uniref:Shikimate dehydrogenase n=1 Tax=Muribaculum caecicola TaxID=3038144 RepID=A0AC61S4Q8_9BACT|nr:shikimate dehydrogenase [Muribaculum caecicola]THG45694.1 shikimate dehydrogenase [Muribaculum caecicola]